MLRHIASVIALALTLGSAPARADAPPNGRGGRPVVEVVFVLDTTGSMGPLIEGAKRKIWSIATAIIDCTPDADIRMGLVAYRDIGDTYVTKKFDLTTDIQGLYGDLLQLRAQGGGDWPESVNEALFVGATQMSWSSGPNTTRIMFLVGDAPPHMDYAQDMKYPDVMRLAHQKGITVNAVQAGLARDTQRVWLEIAQMGNGEYIPIPQDGGAVVTIETPYDREIIELQGQINRTIIPYGPRQQRDRVTQRRDQYSAAPAAVASDMAGYMAKQRAGQANNEAVTGGGDLLADVNAGRQKLGSVPDQDLPDDMRAMSSGERQAHLDRQMTQRNSLNGRMAALVKKRDAYVAEQRSKAPARPADSFDRAVEKTLRSQIK
jgi:Mg-chelatase subunit ChlD